MPPVKGIIILLGGPRQTAELLWGLDHVGALNPTPGKLRHLCESARLALPHVWPSIPILWGGGSGCALCGRGACGKEEERISV
jgi:hypothetical protein